VRPILAKGRRARSADAKDLRRASLVAAAHAALATASYDDVRVESVAAAAGLAKGTAYGYFASKEAMFLAVLVRELEQWFAELERRLRSSRARNVDPLTVVPRAIASTLSARPRLLALLARLHGQLEANTPEDDIRAFKVFLRDGLDRVGGVIDTALGLAAGTGARLLVMTHALTIGLGQMAAPSDVVDRVIRSDPRLAVFECDFAAELAGALESLLRGWAVASRARRP
jgi:AcrR family transcriptional regulator